MNLPDDMRAGVHADVVGVWYTENDFTLDFLVHTQPPRPVDGKVQRDLQVVSRVKLPTSVIFQVAKAIADNVASYEEKVGPLPGNQFNLPPDFGQDRPGS